MSKISVVWISAAILKQNRELSGASVRRELVMSYDIDVIADKPQGFGVIYHSFPNEAAEPQVQYDDEGDSDVSFAYFDVEGKQLCCETEQVSETKFVYHVQLGQPVQPGERIELFSKAIIGDEKWMSLPRHRQIVQRDQPAILVGDAGTRLGTLLIRWFKLPRGCRLYEYFERPRELWADADRLNLLYVFYVRYGGHKAVISIRDLSLLEGRIPPRALGMVVEWASRHQGEVRP
ncbi:MAG: DUF4160 domain-containing protein [Candidatus Poribacteria bacterium]